MTASRTSALPGLSDCRQSTSRARTHWKNRWRTCTCSEAFQPPQQCDTLSPMRDQAQKAAAFRALHEREGAFIIPNPWDAGTARLLAHLGFEALATTSAGYAFSVGRRDGSVERDEMME